MNKEISKEMMNRAWLRNNYLWKRSDENGRKYSKQQNYGVSLLTKTKGKLCSSLDEKNITDNEKVWKTMKPFLSDKLLLI